MSAEKVCRIMEEAVRQYDENAEAVSIPLADGGEGTAERRYFVMSVVLTAKQ